MSEGKKQQPIQKRGGISLPVSGRPPTKPPKKPADASSSAKPATKSSNG